MIDKAKCEAVLRGDRIQFIIGKNDKGYAAFSKVLKAMEKRGGVLWYGDVVDSDNKDRMGFVITAAAKKTGWVEQK